MATKATLSGGSGNPRTDAWPSRFPNARRCGKRVRFRVEGVIVQAALEEVGMTTVGNDLSDELTVMCAYAHLGGDLSDGAGLAENYFARIESAGKNAAQLMQQLLSVELPVVRGGGGTSAIARPVGEQMTVPTDEPVRTPSSFRRRLGLTF